MVVHCNSNLGLAILPLLENPNTTSFTVGDRSILSASTVVLEGRSPSPRDNKVIIQNEGQLPEDQDRIPEDELPQGLLFEDQELVEQELQNLEQEDPIKNPDEVRRISQGNKNDKDNGVGGANLVSDQEALSEYIPGNESLEESAALSESSTIHTTNTTLVVRKTHTTSTRVENEVSSETEFLAVPHSSDGDERALMEQYGKENDNEEQI